MEPQDSLTCFQEPANGPSWVRWIQSTNSHTTFFESNFNIMPSSTSRPSNGRFTSDFKLKSCMQFSFPPCVLHILIPKHISSRCLKHPQRTNFRQGARLCELAKCGRGKHGSSGYQYQTKVYVLCTWWYYAGVFFKIFPWAVVYGE